MKRFTNYLLLNAYSVSSIGLYNGKAGISLCLFELAQYLNDETLEDKAFELLQETLALSSKSEAIDFEAGLSGVGFVLLYLIENQLLGADYEELFGEQSNKILSRLKEQSSFSGKDLLIMCFLELLTHSTDKEEIHVLIDKILTDVGNSLNESLEKFGSKDSGINKFEVLNGWDNYLKALVLYKKYSGSVTIVNRYVELYKQGKIACCFSTGYYLKNLLSSEKINNTAQTIKENAIQNTHKASLTLAQCINLLYLLNQENQCCQNHIDLLEQDLFDTNNPNYEKKIIQSVSNQSLIAGYNSGISRLLLYWVYKKNRLNGSDCSRFKYLF